jgi:hypothetical protein
MLTPHYFIIITTDIISILSSSLSQSLVLLQACSQMSPSFRLTDILYTAAGRGKSSQNIPCVSWHSSQFCMQCCVKPLFVESEGCVTIPFYLRIAEERRHGCHLNRPPSCLVVFVFPIRTHEAVDG